MRYSTYNLVRNALSGHKNWSRAWRDPAPKSSYDAIIIGGGGHGLATAYYLAKNHGMTNIAVLEKGWIGGGNTGRNTTVVRADYLTPEANALFGFSLKLWEGLSQELNFNQMFSQRGIVKVAHGRAELRQMVRRTNALHLAGIDYEMLDVAQIKELVPIMDVSSRPRLPVIGGVIQRRGGVARHDAVAWGYARGADSLGVDIIQKCEVTGFKLNNGRVEGVQTTRGDIAAPIVAMAVAGQSNHMCDMLGIRLPIESHPLQAWVSEPMKPMLPTFVASSDYMFYMSQSDKGELVIGAEGDHYNSFVQRGSIHHIKDGIAGILELFPSLSRVKMMRQWAGIIEHTPDHSPIISKLPIEGVFMNGGWGTGGFKATPGSGFVFADSIANDRLHPFAKPFSLERFETARLVGEHLAAGGYSS
jgi:sarcosine oxidase subunit beta